MKNFAINGLGIIKLVSNTLEEEKIKLTPDTGFNLIGIDYFEDI